MRLHLILLAKVYRQGMYLRYGNGILIVEGSGSWFACRALKEKEYSRDLELKAPEFSSRLCHLWAIYLISMTLSLIYGMRVIKIHTTSEGWWRMKWNNAFKKYLINCKAPTAIFVIGIIKANMTFFERSEKENKDSMERVSSGQILRCPS